MLEPQLLLGVFIITLHKQLIKVVEVFCVKV
jgi:hypothetical protein